MFKLVSGLKTNYADHETFDDVNDVEELCKTSKNKYLVYKDDEFHKIYFDIDMPKVEYEKLGDFETINNKLLKFLNDTFTEYSDLSIATSSQLDKKLSYRVILNDYKVKIKDMKDLVNDIKQLPEFNEFKNTIDTSVYSSGGKIRLPYCSKDGEDRPFVILKGKFKDFLTCRTDKAKEYDMTPVNDKKIQKQIEKEAKQIKKDKLNNNKISDELMTELLNSLDVSRCNAYDDWIKIGMALKNDGYDIKLYHDFSKRSNKYQLGCDARQWYGFKQSENPITTASLWYYLSLDNEKKFKDLRNKVDGSKYDFKIDITEKHFDEKKMYTMMNEDIEQFGIKDYKARFFSQSKSFQYFNHFHFYLIDTEAIFKVYFVGSKKEITHISTDGYKCFEYQDKPKFSFVQAWLACINKQCYTTMDFSPNEPLHNNAFNLFDHFAYEDGNKDFSAEKIQTILDHIKYLVNEEGKKDTPTYEYVLNWLAHIIQRPERKTESALVFSSRKEGIGKNAFTDLLEKIFEGYITSIESIDTLAGKFNSILKSKLVVFGDEISPKAKELNDVIKKRITSKNINIEYKGLESIKMKDRSNYIFTTNNELAFKVSDEDRRFCLIECPRIKKDAVYFDNLYKALDDQDTLKNFYNFLLSKDLSNVNIRNIPMTDYKKRNVLHNLPSYIQMIVENPEFFAMKDMTIQALKNQCSHYEKDTGKYHTNYTDRKLALDMTEWFGEFKHHTKTGNQFRFTGIEEFSAYINEKFNTVDE
jgi:hypothetical protein